jgi:hypothetical protein
MIAADRNLTRSIKEGESLHGKKEEKAQQSGVGYMSHGHRVGEESKHAHATDTCQHDLSHAGTRQW